MLKLVRWDDEMPLPTILCTCASLPNHVITHDIHLYAFNNYRMPGQILVKSGTDVRPLQMTTNSLFPIFCNAKVMYACSHEVG